MDDLGCVYFDMRNPKWTEDEIVLALDLYFRSEFKDMEPTGNGVIELSELLNVLPGQDRKANDKFRNANGVSMKLQNFKAFDPRYDGKGLDRGSRLDQIVFNRYWDDQESLRRRASQLKSIVEYRDKLPGLETVHDDEVPMTVTEGRTIFKLHRTRERDSKIIKRKKEDVLTKTGKLECEACGFDFKKTYGDLGEAFCEVHHRVPLSELQAETKTSLKDLAVVCANCHRMLHRMKEGRSVKALKSLLQQS